MFGGCPRHWRLLRAKQHLQAAGHGATGAAAGAQAPFPFLIAPAPVRRLELTRGAKRYRFNPLETGNDDESISFRHGNCRRGGARCAGASAKLSVVCPIRQRYGRAHELRLLELPAVHGRRQRHRRLLHPKQYLSPAGQAASAPRPSLKLGAQKLGLKNLGLKNLGLRSTRRSSRRGW
jgi:hypothetical protein